MTLTRVRSVLAATCLILATAAADAQPLAWARQGGGPDLDGAAATAVDPLGNVYIVGNFGRSLACFYCGRAATFGAGQPTVTVLTAVDGSQDIFVAKYDANGVLLWARRAGGSDDDDAYGIAIDAGGSVFVAGTLGRFTSTADFGNGVTSTSPGAFVTKYDANGNAVWVNSMEPSGIAVAVSTDGNGNSYAAGAAPDPTLGGSVIALWSLAADGSLRWTRRTTGDHQGGAAGVSTDAAGNSHVTGRFYGAAVFGAGQANATTLTDLEGGAGELFVAKFNAAGDMIWAKQSADLPGLVAYGNDIATDAGGNSVVVGTGWTILGHGEANETAIAGDGFVAKYDSAGQLAWAKTIAGRPIEAHAVAVNQSGVYVAGGFATSITFASGEPNQTTLVSLGGFMGADMFIARYGVDGAFEWARQAGGGTVGHAVAVDSLGNAVVAGYFFGSPIFGWGEPNETTLNATAGGPDAFVAKLLAGGAANRPPVADDQHISTPEDTAASLTLGASDPDADPLTYTVVIGPQHGVLNGTPPQLTYTPHLNYQGSDSFTFRVFDGEDWSGDATVSITVTPVNDPPVAHAQTRETPENTPLPVTLTGQDVDGDVLAFSVVSGPAHGTLSGAAPNLTYTPAPGYSGPDTFTFTAHDGTAFSAPATVTIGVGLPNVVCGSLTSGSIGVIGEIDRYVFIGQAGQRISLALATTGGFSSNPAARNSVRLTLVAPSGAVVGALQSNSHLAVVLPQTGSYEVRVNARDLITLGSYNFNVECLFPVQSPDTVTLVCGTLASGKIGAPGQVDLYRLSGDAGQRIAIALATTGGFSSNPAASNSVQVTIFAPSGVAVATLRSNSQLNVVLPETGTYVLRANATNLATTGAYNVNIECLFPSPSPDTVELQCGTLASGKIGAPGQVDLYRLSGEAGQRIAIALATAGGFSSNPAASNSVQLTIFAPSGAAVATLRSNSQINVVLPETGTYVLRVNATNLATVGAYNINVECLSPAQSPDTVELSCGTLASGNIGAPGQVNMYRFNGSAGQLVAIAVATTGGFSSNPAASNSAQVTVTAPSGTAIATLRTNQQMNVVLPENGLYVLRVNATNLATVGSYKLNVECLFPSQSPGTTALVCGGVAANAIGSPAQVDLLTVSGGAGGQISVALATTGGFSSNPAASNSAQLTVYAPSGAALATLRSNSQAIVALPAAGTYVLRVNATNLATIGSYRTSLGCP